MIRLVFFVLVLSFAVPVTAKSPWKVPVARATNDRKSDLVDVLIQLRRYADALQVCELEKRGADPLSDEIAKWAIRQSKILTAKQMGQERFEETDIESAQAPVNELITGYANHRRLLFLQAQRIGVLQNAAYHSVLRASVSRSDESSKEIAIRRLLSTTTDALELAKKSADTRAQLDSNANQREFGFLSDLVRLQQELQVVAVSMTLMQTELFAARSKDAIAAATQAEQAALQAITKLPVGTLARREVERLKTEAIYRTGQLDRADAEAEKLSRSYLPSIPPRVQALLVRLDIAQKRMGKAAGKLQAYYGDNPVTATPSIEMDLARVQFLMQSKQTREFGDWLEIVEKRGGALARRRAEAISLANIRQDSGPQLVDPSIVAAQGQDWLRRGNPSRGGDLLAESAKVETDPDRAIQRATQAAAAMVLAERKLDAADVLAEVSIAKSTGINAAEAHLQSAVLVSTVPSSEAATRIEELLREHLQQWPSGESASSARTWLIKLLTNKQQLLDAAVVATDVPSASATVKQIETAIELWKQVFLSSGSSDQQTNSQRLIESFQPLLERSDFRILYAKTATLLLGREQLGQVSPIVDGLDSFTSKLLEFRESFDNTITIEPPPESDDTKSDRTVATWRLTQDGRQFEQHRKAIAGVLRSWDANAVASIATAERLLWSEQTELAIAMLEKLASEPSGEGDIIRQAASLLSANDATSAKQAAIELWDRLASGTPQGTRPWHEAKLGAIRSLRENGKVEEAQRRAKYILLTTSGISADIKTQYESLAR